MLRALALRAVTAFFFYGFFATLYMLYAIQTLRLTPIVLGFVITLGGVGNLFGALIAERLTVRWPVGWVLIGSTLFSGFLALLIPLAGGPWYVAAAFLGASQLFGDVGVDVDVEFFGLLNEQQLVDAVAQDGGFPVRQRLFNGLRSELGPGLDLFGDLPAGAFNFASGDDVPVHFNNDFVDHRDIR